MVFMINVYQSVYLSTYLSIFCVYYQCIYIYVLLYLIYVCIFRDVCLYTHSVYLYNVYSNVSSSSKELHDSRFLLSLLIRVILLIHPEGGPGEEPRCDKYCLLRATMTGSFLHDSV